MLPKTYLLFLPCLVEVDNVERCVCSFCYRYPSKLGDSCHGSAEVSCGHIGICLGRHLPCFQLRPNNLWWQRKWTNSLNKRHAFNITRMLNASDSWCFTCFCNGHSKVYLGNSDTAPCILTLLIWYNLAWLDLNCEVCVFSNPSVHSECCLVGQDNGPALLEQHPHTELESVVPKTCAL